MERPKLCIVDVFAEEKYTGNQLAVFRNTQSLSDRDMQLMAKEMHYSETTFILSDEEKNGGYDVRIFTPQAEIPFAGHPTLGTAFIIQQDIIRKPVESVVLNLKVGQIPVRFTYISGKPDVLWMKTKPPVFGEQFDADKIAESLQIEKDSMDARYPVQAVSTGLPFIIAPLKSLDAVKRASVAKDIFFKIIESTEAKAIFVFCPETIEEENDLNVRVFVDYYGIPEDPATGSANSCLAGYLAKYKYFGKDNIDVRVEQGYEIGRPSLLLLKAQENRGDIDVEVGGRVVLVARGEFV
jgi:trans-2,3-dihydro-3-hydroxyanthranilate isomerase